MGELYTIPASDAFLASLVRGLCRRFEPLALSQATLILPTRRSVTAARDAFFRELEEDGAGALFLPRLVAVGDLGDGVMAANDQTLPRPLEALRARCLLAELVRARDPDLADEQAFRLADELLALLNDVAVEGGDLRLGMGLVPEELAAHWQAVAVFLNLLGDTWPAVLEQEEAILPAAHQVAALNAIAVHWQAEPPAQPIIAAGLSGSQPAVADLVRVIAGMPRGIVILAGYQPTLSAEHLQPRHPQWTLARLVAGLPAPASLRSWPAAERAAPTARLDWVQRAFTNTKTEPDLDLDVATAGVRYLEAAEPGEEALAIAIRLREAASEPGRSGVLVTTDRQLARRVAIELRRWGLRIDDSAGQPLDQSTAGRLALLCAHWLLAPDDPPKLMALLHHPWVLLGLERGEVSGRTQALERAFRERQGREGTATLTDAATDVGPQATDLLARLENAARPFRQGPGAGARAAISVLAETHFAVLGNLLRSAPIGEQSDPESEEAVLDADLLAFRDRLIASAEGTRPIALTAYPPILASAMAKVPVRRIAGDHPSLAILGRMESRLLHADILILGGLNEGAWPTEEPGSPWLAASMRSAAGLPDPEQALGIAAQDFAHLVTAAPDVLLTRSRRDAAGAPTSPSRFLVLLERILLSGDRSWDDLAARELQCWAQSWDRPAQTPRPLSRPAPCPPATARPRRLSVSDIERLISNPYAVYAERVLGLSPLPPLSLDPGAAERGSLVHRVLETFVRERPNGLEEEGQALSALLQTAERVFDEARLDPAVRALWAPRFARIASWFVRSFEAERRSDLVHVAVERSVHRLVDLGTHVVRLRGRIDRLERDRNGAVRILDYKTGTVPQPAQVERGEKPQLPLLAWLLAAEDQAAVIAELAYVELKGARPPGAVHQRAKDPAALVSKTKDAATAFLAAYALADTPFVSIPRPSVSRYRDPFAQLSRDAEWLEAEVGG